MKFIFSFLFLFCFFATAKISAADQPPQEAPYVSPQEEDDVAPPENTQVKAKAPTNTQSETATKDKLNQSIEKDHESIQEGNARIDKLHSELEEIQKEQNRKRMDAAAKQKALEKIELDKARAQRSVPKIKKREYVYPRREIPQHFAASLRAGPYYAPALVNPESSLAFNQIYTNPSGVIVLFDFEYQFSKSFGKWGIKGGSGVYTASGNGRFRTPPYAIAKEVYTFFLFPNNVSAIWRGSFWKNQFIVPFVEGGGGYYTFAEVRDDYKRTKYGGALVAQWAAGGALLLDAIAPGSMGELESDYGISHMYVVAEYRSIIGLRKDFDFSTNYFDLGFMFEF